MTYEVFNQPLRWKLQRLFDRPRAHRRIRRECARVGGASYDVGERSGPKSHPLGFDANENRQSFIRMTDMAAGGTKSFPSLVPSADGSFDDGGHPFAALAGPSPWGSRFAERPSPISSRKPKARTFCPVVDDLLVDPGATQATGPCKGLGADDREAAYDPSFRPASERTGRDWLWG